MPQIKARKVDFVWNYIGLFFRMGTSLLLMPFLLSWLTDELVGLWYVFLAISSFVNTFQAGFSPSFARNVSYCWSGAKSFAKTGRPRETADYVDYAVLKTLIAACKKVYKLISIIVLLIISTIGTVYILYVASSLPFEDFIPAWIVFCFAIFCNLYWTYYESLLRGVGDFEGVNKATILSNILQLLVAFTLLLAGFEIFACALAFLVQGFVYRILCRSYFFQYKSIGEQLASVTYDPSRSDVGDVVRAVYPNALKDCVVSFSNYLMTNANTVLCSLYLDLNETGVFSVTLQILNAVANVSSVVLTTYQPTLQSAFSNGNGSLEKEVTGRVYAGFIAVYLGTLIPAIFIVLPLLGWFKGDLIIDWVLVALMSMYFFLWRLHSTSATLITNTNQVPYMRAFFISAVLGATLSIVFMQFFGLGTIGLIGGQALVQLFYNNWKWPHEASRRLNTTLPLLMGLGLKSWMEALSRKERK